MEVIDEPEMDDAERQNNNKYERRRQRLNGQDKILEEEILRVDFKRPIASKDRRQQKPRQQQALKFQTNSNASLFKSVPYGRKFHN